MCVLCTCPHGAHSAGADFTYLRKMLIRETWDYTRLSWGVWSIQGGQGKLCGENYNLADIWEWIGVSGGRGEAI